MLKYDLFIIMANNVFILVYIVAERHIICSDVYLMINNPYNGKD